MRNRSLKIENEKKEWEIMMMINNHNHIMVRIPGMMASKNKIKSKNIELNRIVDQEKEVEVGVEEIDKKMVTSREQSNMKIERNRRMKIKVLSLKMLKKKNLRSQNFKIKSLKNS